MKSIKYLAICIIAIIVITSSCKKDNTDPPVPGVKSNIDNILKSKRPTDQVFSVTAGTYQTITGASGTKVSFNPSSFQNRDGSLITSGTVQVSMTELYGVDEMMSYNAITISGGRLLQSGGEVLLKASKAGAEVFSNGATISFPTTNISQPMSLFYGDFEIDSIDGDTTIVWDPVDSTIVTNPTRDSSSSSSTTYYNFTIDSFTWINCDYFYSSGSPLTDINFVSNDSMVDSNTAVFVYFPSINALTRTHGFDPITHTFTLGWGYQIPVGLNFTVISISEVNGNYYSYIQNHTATSGMTINMNFSPTSLSAFWTAVAAL